MNTFADAAARAAARGWRVLPLRPGTKRPAVNNWEQRATTDPDRIARCWATGPYNIGIATGPSALVVIDLDVVRPGDPIPDQWARLDQPGGSHVLAELAARVGAGIPETYTIGTPSGGRHLYFHAPAGTQIRKDEGRLGWKIDVRAWGGQVVAPGSLIDGRPYTVVDDHEPVELPAWLAVRLTRDPAIATAPARPVRLNPSGSRHRYVTGAVNDQVRRIEDAAGGERNRTLYMSAVLLGQLVAGDEIPDWEVIAVLLGAAKRHVDAGAYTLREAHKTIQSGLRAGAKKPRRINGNAA